MFHRDDQCRIFGITAIENLFLTEYLPGAEGDFVKVYLSCLYHSQLQDEGFGIKEIASELTMEESRVEAALRYWERRRVLTRFSDNPPQYKLHHLGQRMLTGQDSLGGDRAYINFSEAVYALFSERRKIRPNEIATAYEWVQDLELPQSIVLMLLSHCIATRGIGFTFKYAEKIAVHLKEEGITTEEDAERFFNRTRQVREGAKAVLRRFGLRRAPTEDELNLYQKWTDEMNFSQDDILAACAETVKASNPTFAYLNGILEGLHKRRGNTNVKTQLQNENDLLEATKEVLQTLGVRVNPVSVQNAYKALNARFPHEMIVLAAEAVRRKNGKFEDLAIALSTWQQKGMDTVEKVQAYLHSREHMMPLARKVLNACGQEGSPSNGDMSFIEGWLQHHSPELIEYAALQARNARQKMPYIDKVLTAWNTKGIVTVAQAKEEVSISPTSRPSKEVGAHRYDQREYTEQQMETGMEELIEEARKNRAT